MTKKSNKLTKEQLEKRRDSIFRRKIRTTFINAGFSHINTMNKHHKVGNRIIEIDAIFYCENIILICEDTAQKTNVVDHIRNKSEAFTSIKNNWDDYFEWICENFDEHSKQLRLYSSDRCKVFNLYFSQNELSLDQDDRERFKDIIFIEPKVLNYFNKITNNIKYSSRYEIFRFLGVKCEDVGSSKSDEAVRVIKAPIVCPNEAIGFDNGIRVVSFMMSANLLLKTAYVMRKDNWEESHWPYQRLIEKEKISSIRQFLAKKGQAFFNNIIVGLPNTIKIIDEHDKYASIKETKNLEKCRLLLPEEWNSICVIDGQHRIFAHYEGLKNDKLEHTIASLRDKRHLLVTGLIFPEEMTSIEVAQVQSQIFVDINSNSKSVPADVLLHIEMISNPFSDIGLARRIIEYLNKEQLFLNKFELSSMDESKIKVASIIKFALRYLVVIKNNTDKINLFNYFPDGKEELLRMKDEKILNKYIAFCSKNLNVYFSAVKNRFKKEWDDNASKLLSVTSINGFIIAYTRQLPVNGIQDFKFYESKLKNLNIDFSNDKFQYTSSQYRKFSDQIIREAFGLDTTEV